MEAGIINTEENGDGTSTINYTDGSYQIIDDTTGETIEQSGPSFDNSSTSSGTNTAQNSYDVNGITYTKNADGTYSKTTETGTVPSTAKEFETAASGGDPEATPTLSSSQVSTTPTTARTTQTVTGTGGTT